LNGASGPCFYCENTELRLRLADLQSDAKQKDADWLLVCRAFGFDGHADPEELVARAARLAEAERNEGTLLGMIRHQRDVLRECLPYINESMAGKRPGRSADDIRAAVKALTSASADGPKGEK